MHYYQNIDHNPILKLVNKLIKLWYKKQLKKNNLSYLNI